MSAASAREPAQEDIKLLINRNGMAAKDKPLLWKMLNSNTLLST